MQYCIQEHRLLKGSHNRDCLVEWANILSLGEGMYELHLLLFSRIATKGSQKFTDRDCLIEWANIPSLSEGMYELHLFLFCRIGKYTVTQ